MHMKLSAHKHLKRQLKVEIFCHLFLAHVYSTQSVLMHEGNYPHVLESIVFFSEGLS